MATEAQHWVTISGKHVLIGGDERTARATASYKPQTKAKMRIALAQEAILAKLLGGKDLPDNEPFDVIAGRNAFEVKTIIDGANPKITMHPPSLARKVAAAKANGWRAQTIAVDARGDTPRYYYKDGIGSFRLSSMTPMSKAQLRGLTG